MTDIPRKDLIYITIDPYTGEISITNATRHESVDVDLGGSRLDTPDGGGPRLTLELTITMPGDEN